MSEIVSVHDRFFKSAMSDIRVAKEFFTTHLSNELLSKIDLTTLNLCPGSYIDKELTGSASDILYAVDYEGQSSYLYILAEHQSTPDKLMPFRLLRYIVSIMTEHLKKTSGKTLPLVYPLVFYNGKRRYPYSMDIRDLFNVSKDTLTRFIRQPFHLIDTHDLEDELLKQQQWSGVMSFMMKHIYARDVVPYIKEIMGLLRSLERNDGGDYIISLLYYVLEAGDTVNPEALIEIAKEGLSAKTEGEIMTIAERLIQKGRLEGWHKGVIEGKAEGKAEGKQEAVQLVARRLLIKGYTKAEVAEVTGLSLIDINNIGLDEHH